MTDSIAIVASALRADAEALRVISQNVANSQTPAYRREVPLVYSTFDALAGVSPANASPEADSAATSDPLRLDSSVDLRPGTLQSTGEPLNLAIEGNAFFVVDTARGERLTRRGDFRLDGEGRLVTASGDAVLGSNGAMQIRGAQPVIGTDGTVRAGDAVIDKVRLVEVPGAQSLKPEGDGLYALAEGTAPLDTAAAQVRQGFIETSNVQSVDEMIALMEAMRRFESAQRFIRGYDSMLDNAITTLGKV
ncbi:MAG: flagellar hook basal-body protein [Gammaproteobacteria bacterium]